MLNRIDSALTPKRATKHSAGYDIVAPYNYEIDNVESTIIDTGIFLTDDVFDDCLSTDIFAMIVPRSSYGFKYGLRFDNTVCIIDADYRDSIKLSCKATTPFVLKEGDRFAQLIFIRYHRLENEEVPKRERNGGIGSTDSHEH